MGVLPLAIPLIGGMSTAGVIGTGLAAAGIGLAFKSQVDESKAQNKALDYQAAMNQQNAYLSQQQAADSTARGAEEEKRLRLQTEELKGRQRAAYAASGVMVDEGSSLDTLADTAMYGEDDALTLRANAAREAWGHNVAASNYTAQAQLNKMSKANPYVGAAGGLLTGTSSLLRRV